MTDRAWVWGRHPVLEAVRAGRVRRVLVSESARLDSVLREIETAAAGAGVPVVTKSPAELSRLAPRATTQGVIAEVATARLLDAAELLDRLDPASGAPFLLVLDQVQDPHNFGSLLRTADAAGVHGVAITERRSVGLTGVVAKTSAGAVNFVPVALAGNLVQLLERMKSRGIWIVGLDADAQQTLYDVDLTMPLALVLGAEGSGLRRLTQQHVDLAVRIPMYGQVASLNVGVAGGVAMFEVVRQRRTRC